MEATFQQRTRRRRRSHSGAVWRARFYLAAMWIFFAAHGAWLYFLTPSYAQRSFLAYEFPWAMATTSLLIGVGCRQDWARYFATIVLIAHAGLAFASLLKFTDQIFSDANFAFRELSGPVLDLLIVWGVIGLPDIRRMVSRQYD